MPDWFVRQSKASSLDAFRNEQISTIADGSVRRIAGSMPVSRAPTRPANREERSWCSAVASTVALRRRHAGGVACAAPDEPLLLHHLLLQLEQTLGERLRSRRAAGDV